MLDRTNADTCPLISEILKDSVHTETAYYIKHLLLKSLCILLSNDVRNFKPKSGICTIFVLNRAINLAACQSSNILMYKTRSNSSTRASLFTNFVTVSDAAFSARSSVSKERLWTIADITLMSSSGCPPTFGVSSCFGCSYSRDKSLVLANSEWNGTDHSLCTQCHNNALNIPFPPQQAKSNIAENVPHVAKFIHAFCPTFSLGPSPFEILYPHLESID